MTKKTGEILEGGKVVVWSNGASDYVTKSSVVSETQFEAYSMEGYLGSHPSLTLAIFHTQRGNLYVI